MTLLVRTLIVAGCLMAVATGARAESPTDPLRVAWTRGVEPGPQPMVGRFGLLPPKPLFAAPLPVECYTGSSTGAKPKPSDPAPMPELTLKPHAFDCRACETACPTGDFSADAWFAPYDACEELGVYNGKQEVPTQRPWVEWGVPFYDAGPVPKACEALGCTNLSRPRFYVYGDYRIAFAQNELATESNTVLAHRLNLELDYWFTSTERIHAFLGPFQEDGRFMRIEDGEFFNELDLFQGGTDTLFFEGDLGAVFGGFDGTYATFDLPVTLGLVPLFFQNGVWAFDAMVGGAVTIPAQNSPGLDWSNYDVTLFAGVDRISSAAFGFDDHAARLVGATTFIESRGGYFELGYGYVDDEDSQDVGDRSYHNVGLSYTRRYANRVSNSLRLLLNAGQESGASGQAADGALLLIENSLLTKNPYNAVPYINLFAGFDRPQPLARAAANGGVLFNTGILFQSDLLTGYPTLDATGADTYGVAVGVDLLSEAFDQQLIVEAAALGVRGSVSDRTAPGDQTGLGVRWQKRLNEAWLIRADAMIGWLERSDDIAGGRVELRWKF